MPKKSTKQTKDTEVAQVTETKPTKAVKAPKVEKAQVKQTEQPVQHVQTATEESQNKKSVRKAGRTVLVKSMSGATLSSSSFDSLEGLTNKSETKASSSYFLTFDSVANAVKASRKLRAESTDYRVKFSYYRIFFTMNGLTDTTEYNQVKKELMDHVTAQSGSSVLYCKFYRKDNKYLGCGDLTVDTIDGMNALLSKDGGKKEFTIGTYTGTFYRFNGKKDKSDDQAVETSA